MQQRSEAALSALRKVREGKIIDPGRYKALQKAGLVDQSRRGFKARRWLTEAGEQLLAEAEA